VPVQRPFTDCLNCVTCHHSLNCVTCPRSLNCHMSSFIKLCHMSSFIKMCHMSSFIKLCHRSSFIKFLTENVQLGLTIIYYESHKEVYSKTDKLQDYTVTSKMTAIFAHKVKRSYIHLASMQNKVLFDRQPIHPLNACLTPMDK